jgi:hypothetical protein
MHHVRTNELSMQPATSIGSGNGNSLDSMSSLDDSSMVQRQQSQHVVRLGFIVGFLLKR